MLMSLMQPREMTMRRLMFVTLAASTLALGPSGAIAQQKHKAGSTYCHQNPEACQAERAGTPAKTENTTAPTSQVSLNGNLYKFNANVTPFVPGDLAYANRSQSGGFNCDANGRPSAPMPNSRCIDFVSQQEGSTWRLRKIMRGTVEAIFLVGKGGTLVERARFDGNGHLVSATPEAKQYALAKGYRLDERNNTMVAVNAPTAAPAAALNCKNPRSADEHLACAKQNGGPVATTGATSKPAPAPTAQALDCSKLSALLRMKCEAEKVIPGSK
jgi:uncharacterized membrane protein